MEPVGATASMLTLLAAAGQSCKFLYTLSVDLSEAPKDIQNQAVKLQSFDLTVQQLLKAYEKLPPEFEVDARLRAEIARFESEVTSMRIKIERKLDASRQSRKHQFRESCKWLLFDRQMTKFLQSADHWSLIMSHAAMTAQIALSSRIDRNVVALLSLTQQLGSCTTKPAKETANEASLHHSNLSLAPIPYTMPTPQLLYRHENRPTPGQFAKRVSTYTEPVGFAPKHWTAIILGALTVNYNCGSLISRQISQNGQDSYRVLRASEGYGLNLIAQCSSLLHGRVTLLLLATFSAGHSLKLSLRFNLHWGRLFAYDSPHALAVMRGDIHYLMHHFSSRTLGVTDVTSNGDTLLHFAAGYNQSAVIDLLMNEGADVNATNNGGETPLHICLRMGKNYTCARKLLHHGADLHRANKDARTPLHAFFNPVIGQIIRSHKDELDALCQDTYGMTIAHWASWTSQSVPEDITYQSLMKPEKSFSPYHVLDAHGKSMLHFAAERGNVSLVQHLLGQPEASRMTAPDSKGRTLLHYAAASSRFGLVYPMLVAHQPDIYQRDWLGQTFLHYAAVRDNVVAIQYVCNMRLVSEKDMQKEDVDGRTALQLARLCGRTAVVELLQAHFPGMEAIVNPAVSDCEAIVSGEKTCREKTVKKEAQHTLLKLYPVAVLIVVMACWEICRCH